MLTAKQKSEPSITQHASELRPDQRWCTCCEKPLARKVAWLELDQRIDEYHDFGGVPDDKSQGWFQFGMTCARKKIAMARSQLSSPRRELQAK